MPDDPVADEIKKPTRFIAEEVPSEQPVAAPMPTPVATLEPEVEEQLPHHMSHSSSQFSAGLDTANLFPSSLSDEPKKSSSNKGLVLLTLALLAAALGVVGFIFYKRSQSNPDAAPIQPVTTSVSATPSPIASASPSAAMALDRAKLKVKVQNGSGITGLASKAKTYLEDLGYKDVKTGNASSSDFEETEVAVKAEFESVSSSIVNDLKDKYTVATKIATLDENEDFDVVITLGKN